VYDSWESYDGGVRRHRSLVAGQRIDLQPGHIVASAILRDCVPIESIDLEAPMPEDWSLEHGTVVYCWPPGDGRLLLTNRFEHPTIDIDIDDQEPLGDYRQGRWAWLLDDIQPTTERCPACWGDGVIEVFNVGRLSPADGIAQDNRTFIECSHCVSAGTCPPISAKGRQGIWRWEP